MRLVSWNVFRSLVMKIRSSCLMNKQIYTPTNFWQQILIWNHDPELEVGWIQTDWSENPNWISHSSRYCTETWEWNVFLQKGKYCDTILPTNNDRKKIPSPPKIPSLCRQFQIWPWSASQETLYNPSNPWSPRIQIFLRHRIGVLTVRRPYVLHHVYKPTTQIKI